MSARVSVRRARIRMGGAALALAAVAASPLVPLPAPPAGAEPLTVAATADATAFAHDPDVHQGSATAIEIDGSPEKEAFLRFAVPALPGALARATLRLFSVDGSGNGPEVYRAATAWDEATLSWSQRPARDGGLVADVGAVHAGTWTTWDVTAAVTGPGPLALALVPDSTDGADFASREAGENPPQLVLEVGAQPPPPAATATFTPVADGRVDANHPASNYGTSSTLSAQGAPDPPMETYLRFAVPGLAGPVRRATLRLFVTNATKDGPAVFGVTGAWEEGALTWENRPGPAGAALADVGEVATGWLDYDVTRAVSGPGTFNLALVSSTADSFGASSREATASERPQLVVETGTTTTTQPPTTTSSSPTSTTSSSTTTTRPGPAADCDPPDWKAAEVVGRLPSGYAEMSGLVGSTRYPGWAWGVRDSGNPASLYAFRLPGPGGGEAEMFEFPVPGTSNSDWEDVAYTRAGTGPGTLWILENRGNAFLGNRTLYQVAEPDPDHPGPAQLIGRYTIAYPDGQWNSETLFVFHNDLALISKTSPARVYRFLTKPLPLTVNIPVLVGALPEVSNPSIGSVSPDGRLLAVATHSNIRVYENRGDLLDLLDLIARPAVFKESMPTDNREGGAFFPAGSCDILMVSESKNLWRLEHR
jgi:hypothetical protein